MTRLAVRPLTVAASVAALVLVACTPKTAPAPAPATTTTSTTTTTSPPPMSCTSAQAQASATGGSTLSQSEARADATQEFDTAPKHEVDGEVPLTTVERTGGTLDVSTVSVSSAQEASDVAAAAAQGNDLVTVEAAQPVTALEDPVTATATNDTYRSQQWALDAVPFETAWAATNGAGATVAVIDTGVQSDHPDLAGQVLPGYRYFHDSLGNAQEATMDPAFDDNGHGTHVSGIVAAVAGNAAGVAGAAPGVKILPIKVLDGQGSGWSDDVARGINYAVAQHVDVISMSLGGGYSSVVSAAVNNAVANGVIVFAAAGNGGSGASPSYPGAEANAIAVASITSSLVRSSFSTTGSYVDVAAPGSSIKSTYPPSTYTTLSGTSMATPYAAAEGALLAAEHPTWSVAQLRDRLLTTANDLGTRGKDVEYGCGLIDPVEAVG